MNTNQFSPEVIDLYPTQGSLKRAIHERFGNGSSQVFFGRGLMTFRQFEETLIRDLPDPKTVLTEMERYLLVMKIIQEGTRQQKKFFYKFRNSKGFSDVLLRLFDEFKSGLVEPNDLLRIQGFGGGKEREIRDFFTKYSDHLKSHNLVDVYDLRNKLIGLLATNLEQFSLFHGVRKIVLHYIYDFTPYRFEILYRIAQKIPIQIWFPIPDDRRKALGFIDRNLRKFEALGDREGKLEIRFMEAAENTSPGVQYLQSNIFSLKPVQGEKEKGLSEIRIVQSSSRYREIEEVGKEIKNLNKRRVPLNEMVLVFRDLSLYGRVVEDIFKRYKIPFHMRRGNPLRSNSLIRFIFGIFDVIDSHFRRDEVRRVVCSKYSGILHDRNDADVPKEFPNNETESQWLVDRLLRESGITYGSRLVWRECFSRLGEVSASTKRFHIKFIGLQLDRLFRHLEKSNRSMKILSFLYWFKRAIAILRIRNDQIMNQEENQFFRDSQAVHLFHQALETCILSLKRFPDWNIRVDYPEFKRFIYRMVENLNVPEKESSNEDRVRVLKINDLPGMEFSTVFICGLHEGEFPMFLQINSILNDRERERFNQLHQSTIIKNMEHKRLGRQVFQTFSEKWDEESLLFYLSVMSARKNLFFTYCTNDLNGKELMRSQYVEDILSILSPQHQIDSPDIIEKSAYLSLKKPYSDCKDPHECRTKLSNQIFQKTETMDPETLNVFRSLMSIPMEAQVLRKIFDRVQIEQKREEFFLESARENRSELSSEYTGRIQGIGKKRLLEKSLDRFWLNGWSPTSLERYSNCPFQFFLQDVMRLKPIELPNPEPDRAFEGELIHEILEHYFRERIRRNNFPMTNLKQEKIRITEISDTVFKQWQVDRLVGEFNLWSRLKEKIRHKLIRFLDLEKYFEESGFFPVSVETEFDSGSSRRDQTGRNQISISRSNKREIFLRGRIDRIDIFPSKNAIRVIDYKNTSSKTRRSAYKSMFKSDQIGSVSFQIPIYMMMAKKFVLEQDLLPEVSELDGCYFFLGNNPGFVSWIEDVPGTINPDFFEPIRSKDSPNKNGPRLADAIVNLIDRIEGGDFQVTPRSCEWCNFSSICRVIPISIEEAE